MEGKEKRLFHVLWLSTFSHRELSLHSIGPENSRESRRSEKKKNHGRHTAVASGVFKNKKCVKIKKNGKRGIDQKERKKSPDLEETNQVVKTFEKIRIFQPPSICLLTCPFPSLLLL